MQSLEYQGPITAVHFHKSDLYVGSGPYLKKFDWKTGALKSSTKVFKTNKIHGITTSQDRIVVWGDRSFAAASLGSQMEEYIVADWIIAAAIDGETTYVLTAHNKVLLVANEKINAVKESEQSILYSGSIFVAGGRVLVAAGTVLEGAVIWDLHSQEVLYRFTHHQGSIFNLAFSPDGKYLATCSDDRCILIYDLSGSDHPVAKGWGHTSRIWNLKFSSDNKHLYSISEDLTCRVWSFTGNSLDCIDIFKGHSGRNVWALDVIELPQPLICTGGQDGGIKLWTKYLLDRHETIHAVQDVIPSPLTNELFKGFCQLGDILVVTTTAGRVFANKGTEWNLVREDIGDYSIVKSIGDYIFVCTKEGRILVFDVTSGTHQTLALPISGNFSFCSGFNIKEEPHVLIQGHDMSSAIAIVNIKTEQSFTIDSPAKQITSVGYFDDRVFVGTRTGAVCSTSLDNVKWSVSEHILEKRDAITAIDSTDSLVLGSRAGSFGILSANLQTKFANKLQRGSIEGIQVQNNGDLLVYGFRKENLFIWNLTHEYEVANEWCGGGHRTWSLTIDPQNEYCYALVFVKASKLHRISIFENDLPFPKSTVLQKKTHGREIRGMEFHPAIAGLVATAAEDTSLNIGSVEANNLLSVQSCLYRHDSPPQVVHWSEDGALLGSAGAKEEMIIWQLCDNTYLNPIAKLPTTSNMPDLRIMDFNILVNKASTYLIGCIYSDSTIRNWEFDASSNQFRLVSEGKYTDRCLLNMHMLKTDQLFSVVTATDGNVLIFDEQLEIIAKHTVHQSGIRGSAVEVARDGFFLYTGGEDNSLSGTFVNNKLEFQRVFTATDAHSATITDVEVHGDFVYSTGPDQKICKWSKQGVLEQAERTSISDTACLSVSENRLLCCGMGISIYSL